MLTYDNLKSIYDNGKKPCWIAYKGVNKSQQIGSYFGDGSEEAANIQDGGKELEDLINRYGDGVYTIELRSNAKASKGNDTHQFSYGDPTVGRVDRVATVAPAQPNPVANFYSGLDFRYFLEQSNTQNGLLQKAQMELLRKEMELEALKREVKEAKKAPGIAGILENPVVINRIFDLVGGQPGQIGKMVTTKQIPAADDDDGDDDDSFEYTPGRLDLNALCDAASRVQRILPEGTHVNDIFDSIAAFCEKDPAQAIQLISAL